MAAARSRSYASMTRQHKASWARLNLARSALRPALCGLGACLPKEDLDGLVQEC